MQPQGFEVKGKEKVVYKLQSPKQAPRQWYKKFYSFMSSSGFLRC